MRGLILVVTALIALAALPFVLDWFGAGFWIGFATRILVYALAAQSLNLVVGYAGLVSFGHAAFFGLGAYAVAVLARHGVHDALLAWPVAIAASAVLAAMIGALALRTRGVYFIMITLAFAQMLYYLAVSLRLYGGEDGLRLSTRSTLPGMDLQADKLLYFVALALVTACFYLLARMMRSRFGRALMAARDNEARAAAIGYPVFRLRLTAFTVAGGIAGLAGALLANVNGFVAPATLAWPESGHLLIMVILGGLGAPLGGAIGAAAVLGLEELLRARTEHWPLALAAVILATALFGRRGLAGMFSPRPA